MSTGIQVFKVAVTRHVHEEIHNWDELDPLDKKILRLLMRYHAITYRHIASYTNKHRSTVHRRIKSLQNKGLVGPWTHAKTRISTVAKRNVQLLQNATVLHSAIPRIKPISKYNMLENTSRGEGLEMLGRNPDMDPSFDTDRQQKRPSLAKAILDKFQKSMENRGVRFQPTAADWGAAARLAKRYPEDWEPAMKEYFTGQNQSWKLARRGPFLHYVGMVAGLQVQALRG